MNPFDAVIYIGLVFAIVAGFKTGLIRSALTILAYMVAMPIAIWAMSMSPPRTARSSLAVRAEWIAVLRRLSVRRHRARKAGADGARRCHRHRRPGRGSPRRRHAGRGPRWPGRGHDRAGVRTAGAVASHQPPCLAGSQLRPLFSAAGQKGFNSLPPDLAATIDRLRNSSISSRAQTRLRHAFRRRAVHLSGPRELAKVVRSVLQKII